MAKHRDRREVLKLIGMAGLSLYMPSCWSSTTSESSTTYPPDENEVIDVPDSTSVEEALKSSHVIYLRKGDEQFEAKRKGFNSRLDKHPAIIALPQNTQGVAEAIRYAIANDLDIAVKSGGHSFEAFSSIDDGMQVNLSLMNSMSWAENHELWVEPGVLLRELYDFILPEGRILPAGSCGTVGVGGLTLGGGYGFFSRKYGLTCDQLLEATLVDGEGNIRSTTNEKELMWALKGGGNGNFGIVTQMKFKTHPAPHHFTRYRFKAYKLDKDRAKQLLDEYFNYADQLPPSCFAAFVLNYKTLVLLITDFENGGEQLKAMIDRFTEITDKADIGQPAPLAKSLKNYYGIQHPIPFKNASAGYYNGFQDVEDCIDEVLEEVLSKRGLIYQVNTLGGAINDPTHSSVSCYPHRDSTFLSELQAYWEKEEQGAPLIQRFLKIQEMFYASGIRKQYRNYPFVELKEWEEAYYGKQYTRLQQAKLKWDPNDRFSQAQSVKLPG